MAHGIEGGSWDRVERTMTLPRLRLLRKFWAKHPKTDWLAASYLKYKPPPDPDAPIKGLRLPVAPPKGQVINPNDIGAAFGLKPGMTIRG